MTRHAFTWGLCWFAFVGCQNKPPVERDGPADPLPPAATSEPKTAEKAAPPTAAPPAATPAAVTAKKKYVVFALGDSITDEHVGGGGYLKFLRHVCPKSEFLDFGKGGDMTNQMRRRFEVDVVPLVRARGGTTLLVYGGVNDLYSNLTAGRTNDRIEDDLSAIYRDARELGLEVVALTVSPWGGFTRYFNASRSENTRLLNSWILGQVTAGPLRTAVDTYPLLSCGEPEKLCLEYENRRPDGLHPGPRGHELLGRAVFEKAFSDCE